MKVLLKIRAVDVLCLRNFAFGDMSNCQLKCPFCFTREQKVNDSLSNLSKRDLCDIKVLIRLRFFHSGINKPMFKFVYPTNKNRLMFDPNAWYVRMNYIFRDK